MPHDSMPTQDRFTATHHALLFAFMSRAVIQISGDALGETVVRAAVRRYGEQRGRRMGLRARAAGQHLTMPSYMAYGEWRAAAGEMEREIAEVGPNVRALVYRCPWHQAWTAWDLMRYGRLYCLEIDEALVRGFSDQLRLDVNATRSNGSAYCEFVYHDADLPSVSDVSPPEHTVMPWEYHLGHLHSTMRDVVVNTLGPLGESAINAALVEFGNCFGEHAVRAITVYEDTDFDRLPDRWRQALCGRNGPDDRGAG